MSFSRYMEKIKGDFKKAVKIEWLNPDETVNFEFTNSVYDMNANVNVNYTKGCRRSCTITINNDNNKFPISFNSIWIGSKFKLWMGIYLDDDTPYYFPQGVFYVSNPDEVYNPSTRTVTLNGVDKWAYLDGKLYGKLTGIYKTNIGTNLLDATRALLKTNRVDDWISIDGDNISECFTIQDKVNDVIVSNDEYTFKWSVNKFSVNLSGKSEIKTERILTAKKDMKISFNYAFSRGWYGDNYSYFELKIKGEKVYYAQGVGSNIENGKYIGIIKKGDVIKFTVYKPSGNSYSVISSFWDVKNVYFDKKEAFIDPVPPLISDYFLTKTSEVYEANGDGMLTKVEKPVYECPYTVTVERGKTLADVLLEYATILRADIYYDVNGRLVLEPLITTADDITDTNKEILWDYSTEDKSFLGMTRTYNFDKVYNDFIVLGNILNGYQFKGRVQNRNPQSDTCVQRIGLRPKEVEENNQYSSDEQCEELAMYDAKIYTIMQKSGQISSIPLFHLDVNKIVTVSTPNNNMSKELYLISGFSLSTNDTMSLEVTSINELKNFSVIGVDVYE